MASLDALRATLPEPTRDLKLNLEAVLPPTIPSPQREGDDHVPKPEQAR